jgi:polyhydroxyalkanoate synthesis regulator phasin
MNRRAKVWARILLASCMALPALPAAAASDAAGDEVRNTIINLLESLVQRGVLTREQAQALVADAQQKAAESAQQRAAQQAATEAAEKDAIRVPYVPQVVQDQIANKVAEQVRPQVTAEVVRKAESDQWGLAAAIPDWLRNLKVYGDVRFRGEIDEYDAGNARDFYVDFAKVNSSGGIGKAGAGALLNTTQDRYRLVGRFRFGATADLGGSLRADLRIASGSPGNPVSANQTLGTYLTRWTMGVDRAALLWTPTIDSGRHGFDLRGGRFDNPFASTSELVWDTDLVFDGASVGWRWNGQKPASGAAAPRLLFATAAVVPLQEVELSTKDKWLFGGQVGTELPLLQGRTLLRLAAGYYDFHSTVGRLNLPDSQLLDFTAPAYLNKGNTLFDIRNDTDTATNLYALAGKYRLASGLLQLDMGLDNGQHVVLAGEYVKNVGWDAADVFGRTGSWVDSRAAGYDVSLSYGHPEVRAFGQWRASVGYRYLERDAVLDAYTDSDFHLGGTDAKGYSLQLDVGVAKSAFARLRYQSANEIDGAPLGIDVLQLDIVGRF